MTEILFYHASSLILQVHTSSFINRPWKYDANSHYSGNSVRVSVRPTFPQRSRHAFYNQHDNKCLPMFI